MCFVPEAAVGAWTFRKTPPAAETVPCCGSLRFGFPTPIRRLFWWWTLNAASSKRPRRAGTFFLTTLAGQGAEIQHPPAFLTSNVTYGPFDERGRSRVTIAYDHRLTDGLQIARCLKALEDTLNGPIAAELEELAGQSSQESRAA